MKTFEELWTELNEKAQTRPEGSGTVQALDARTDGNKAFFRPAVRTRVRPPLLVAAMVTDEDLSEAVLDQPC